MIEPLELKKWLIEIFPSFQDEWDEDDTDVDLTLHGVCLRFTPYFGCVNNDLSENQLKKLGDFINSAVQQNDLLENAVSTCFLEHLHQISSFKILKAYLNKVARDKTHA